MTRGRYWQVLPWTFDTVRGDLMNIGHITQLVKDELGPNARTIYHQDLTVPQPVGAGQPAHLKADTLGAGDFIFVDSGVAGSQPSHDYRADGLLLSVVRPIGAAVNLGEWAAVNMQAVTVPGAFVLVANFNRPSRAGLSGGPGAGTYAPSLLMNASTLMGVTCQFRPQGVRMNLPGTGLMPNRPEISQVLVNKIIDPQHPETFSLALRVTRTVTGGTGKAFFHVGNNEADSFAFNFNNFPDTVPIHDIRAGIGTASGQDYRASVYLLDFQVWA